MPVFPLSWRTRGLTYPSHLCQVAKVKAKPRPASVPAQGYVCPLGAEDSFEQPRRVCGWSRGSGGGLLIPPGVPCPPEHRKELAQRPQIQFCASNPILCLIGREGPRASTVPSLTSRHVPRSEERIRRQFRAFLSAPRQPPLPSPGFVAPALSAPTPWASQRATASRAQTLCSRRRHRAQHPGCWQQAKDTKPLMCTFCPGLLPLDPQWYLNKVCSSVCPYFPVLPPLQSTCNSLPPSLIYLSSSLSPLLGLQPLLTPH